MWRFKICTYLPHGWVLVIAPQFSRLSPGQVLDTKPLLFWKLTVWKQFLWNAQGRYVTWYVGDTAPAPALLSYPLHYQLFTVPLWDVPSLVNVVHYIPMCMHMLMTFQKIWMRVYSVLATNHPLVCIWPYATKMKNSLFWPSFSNSDFPPVTFRVDAKMFAFIPYAIFFEAGKEINKALRLFM